MSLKEMTDDIAAVKALSGIDLKWMNIEAKEIWVGIYPHHIKMHGIDFMKMVGEIRLIGSDPQFAELPSEFEKHGWIMQQDSITFGPVEGKLYELDYAKRMSNAEVERFRKWQREWQTKQMNG